MRKLLSILILAALILTLLPSAIAQDPTVITIWHGWQEAEAELLEEWIDAFTEANPEIEIDTLYVPFDDLQPRFQTAASTGEGADIIIGPNDRLGSLANAGLLAALDEYIDEDLMGQVSETGWQAVTFGGSIYGIPESAKSVALFYNIDIIDIAPETWEEMLEFAGEAQGGDVEGMTFNTGFYQTVGIFYALGGQLMDDEGYSMVTEGDAGVQYLQALQDVFNDDRVLIEGGNDLFREGLAGMIVDGVWNLGTYRDQLGSAVEVAVLPKIGDAPWAPFTGMESFMFNVNASEDVVKAGVEFMRYVTSVEGQEMAVEVAGHVPVNPAVEPDDAGIATFIKQGAIGTPFPNAPEMSAFWEPMADAITAVTEGGEDPAEALAAAAEVVDEKIEQIKTPVEEGDDMAALDGEALAKERCTACHGWDKIEGKAKSEEDWTATVDNMIEKGAELNEDERTAVIAYLAENFGE